MAQRPVIRARTVFVLGAGSSVDLGYPTGASLVRQVINNCRFFCDEKRVDELRAAPDPAVGFDVRSGRLIFRQNEDADLICELLKRFDPNELQRFALALAKSSSSTIDYFLGKNREFSELGKFLIVAHLAKYENVFSLVDNPGSWHEVLLNKIYWEPQDYLRNRLSFLTFNYDVSIDYLLLNRMIHFSCIESGAAVELLRQMSIHHVYGQVGNPAGEFLGERRFSETNWDKMMVDSKRLNIVTEKYNSPGRSACCWSEEQWDDFWEDVERVYFLGFGFDQRNMSVIRTENHLEGKEVFIHLHKPSPDTISHVQQNFNAELFGRGMSHVEIVKNGTLAEFLQAHPPWV